ncbi:hypothetical protein RRG08_024653 [Elysia crispata]|uniref:Uncharacterized protein n=1 Tax=Elysia crispata TaxID=231223 RepID=A0AAE1DNY3_9GAST|nr:hypothetical protein RRG08_024653 [Elysia crispata]
MDPKRLVIEQESLSILQISRDKAAAISTRVGFDWTASRVRVDGEVIVAIKNFSQKPFSTPIPSPESQYISTAP